MVTVMLEYIPTLTVLLEYRWLLYVIVIAHYKGDIIVITWVRGGAKDERNNNDIFQVYELN